MKRVKDYISFEKFESSIGTQVYDSIKKSAKQSFEKISPNAKFVRTNWIWLYIADAVVLILFFILYSYVTFTAAVFFLLLFIGFTTYIAFSINSFKSQASKLISASLNQRELYAEIFKKLDDIEYLGSTINTSASPFQVGFLNKNKPKIIPSDARIWAFHPVHNFIIANEFPACAISVTWRWAVYYKDRIEYHYRTSGHFFIDISNMEESRKFNLSLFESNKNNGYLPSLGLIKLENGEFNKKITLYSDNEIKSRMFATPLYMELALQRLKDRGGFKYNDYISIYGNKQFVEINFDLKDDPKFLELNTDFKGDIEKWTKNIYTDLVTDTYSIYYLLSFITMSSYI